MAPVVSSEDCVDLWSDGETIGQDLEIPKGYSLRDQLTVKGEIKEHPSGRARFVDFKTQHAFTMYTELAANGKLWVKTPENEEVLQMEGQFTPGVSDSLLLQMRCNETSLSLIHI